MITFRGQEIYGTHGIVVAPSPTVHTRRTYFWGVQGTSEILGGKGARTLTLSMWLHKVYLTRSLLEVAIDTIQGWAGDNGPLMEIDAPRGVSRTFADVTFEGLTRVAFQGREDPDPVFDYAGTVDGGWVQPVQMTFRQLRS